MLPTGLPYETAPTSWGGDPAVNQDRRVLCEKGSYSRGGRRNVHESRVPACPSNARKAIPEVLAGKPDGQWRVTIPHNPRLSPESEGMHKAFPLGKKKGLENKESALYSRTEVSRGKVSH